MLQIESLLIILYRKAKVSQDIKISCHNSVIKGSGAKSNDGHPWRNWKITLVAMEGEKEIKGKLSIILDHVCYILHPTFEEPRRDNLTDPKVLTFDLNFAQGNYSKTHKIEFPNASPELIKLLARDPSVNTSSSRKGGSSISSSKSKSKSSTDNNINDTNSSTSSSSSSNSRQTAKKKPASSSSSSSNTPHAKTAKKAKPENMPKPDPAKSKPEKYPKKTSYSPTSLPRSPILNDLSSAPNSSPAHSQITSTATPDSIDEKIVSPSTNTTVPDNDNADHVYSMSDVYNLDSIHRAKLDDETRERWAIPERIYRMTPDQYEEIQQIIADNQTKDMRFMAEEDGGVGVDLYSLGPSLLEKLWDYSADMASDDNQSFTSQDPHASDLELDSDMEQGEYNSDDDDDNGGNRVLYEDHQITDDGEIEDSDSEKEEGEESDYNRYGSGAYEPTGYREIGEFHYTPDHNIIAQSSSSADEPGFRFSESESINGEHGNHVNTNHMANGYANHHLTNGGYHDTSDMDIQDDDDY
ncbi:uncharacterized protein EV154DRAFT_479878 [Mucor mucedo]|uniref:uncharacterized protein n=1 Tax=Mucor mucedo TaxID=29922 RepID=UPI00221F1744|nr:uncharacterized protein EV154DRAFT_479878 [Mucor mucedo]KAI7892967.1 hypothetical protein EV154DRAFT_479878 [Mucor mucedo]